MKDRLKGKSKWLDGPLETKLQGVLQCHTSVRLRDSQEADLKIDQSKLKLSVKNVMSCNPNDIIRVIFFERWKALAG